MDILNYFSIDYIPAVLYLTVFWGIFLILLVFTFWLLDLIVNAAWSWIDDHKDKTSKTAKYQVEKLTILPKWEDWFFRKRYTLRCFEKRSGNTDIILENYLGGRCRSDLISDINLTNEDRAALRKLAPQGFKTTYIILRGAVVVFLGPALLWLTITLWQIALVAGTLVGLAWLSRFTRRLSKSFKLHEKTPYAHPVVNSNDEDQAIDSV